MLHRLAIHALPTLFVLIATLPSCVPTGATCASRPVVAVPSMPPAPLPEEIQKAPAPGMTWIPGAWEWTETQWTWIPGRWLSSPNGRPWQRARTWEEGGTLEFQRGGWACAE